MSEVRLAPGVERKPDFAPRPTRKREYMRFYIGCFLFCLFSTVAAQPSGGPYGPIRQTYKLPTGAGKIYYVAPDGQAEQSGESLSKPTTIEAAIARVRTGDAIIMRGGTYRTGNLILNQGITIQPYADEQPVLKGTEVATKWENLGNGLWTTKWSRLFPSKPADWWRRHREGKKTPLHRFNNDMVFVDGRFLQSAGWEGEVNENSFYIDYETGLVYIGVDPADRLVEITAFDVALLRTTKEVHGKTSDRKGYTIRGITFTQYAYRALEIEGTEPEGISEESKHGKEVVGTTLEHCTISYCSRVAGYLRGDRMTIRHCKVSDTSTEGIYIIASNDVLLEKNIFMRNNIENITGYYPAAVKIFNQSYRVTCNDNLVIDQPNSNGIWYDVGNVDGVFTNNWIEGVGRIGKTINTDQLWPSDNGFFFEISKGAICAGNVFVNCDHGLMVLNASNVQIYQNTFINSMACIGRNARSAAGDHFGWHPSTGPDVDQREGQVFVNNLLVGDENFNRPLLFVWQPASLCERLNKPQLKQLDYNVYVRGADKTSYPLILWSPAANENCQVGFESFENLRRLYPEFAANCRYYANYDGPLFKGMELGNYQLSPDFPGAKAGMQLPAGISKLLGPSQKVGRYVGAYPPMP
ncbi:MAG: right-handed parallel beta-helix repeat-containing protein [candidate division KSB1 bacterium]|nr:right-handed parallel beta-helix repeat-containing protein [candidate division KSB1 bacterium]MDZ7302546.1 right-handed parallel beta-helix repeat-containing protein [candidate division KSB1 bacterium]MDZ7310688.1 right-handed parallel beta-helix repeat-containing protein [candidate division KSB1 bacterium]